MKNSGVSAAIGCVIGLGLLLADVAGTGRVAAAETLFDGAAAAYGVTITASNQSTPLGLTPEGSAPTAQARLSSAPLSTAYASSPYPGDTLVGLPGLVNSLVAGSPPLPPYPLYVSTVLGDQPKDLPAPGTDLHAESSVTQSLSKATSGSSSSGYAATSRVWTADGEVTALADARQSALGLGDLATLDGIHSVATVVLSASGKLSKTSSLRIASIRVPGATLTLPANSPSPNPAVPSLPLPLGGTAVHAPELGFRDGTFVITLPVVGSQSFAVPASSVFQALATVGIHGSFQAARTTPTGIIGAGLTLTADLPAPPDNPGLSGPTKLTLNIGESTASIASTTYLDGVAQPGGSAPIDAPPLGGASSPADSSGSLAPGGTAQLGTPTGQAVSPVFAGPAPSAAATALRPTATRGPLRLSSTLDIYLALVAACALGTLASQALRLLGVRA